MPAALLASNNAGEANQGPRLPKWTWWELLRRIEVFGEGRDERVQESLAPLRNLALGACHRRTANAKDASKVDQVLQPVVMPSKYLKGALKGRLNTTLGRRQPRRRVAPAASPPTPQQVERIVMALMQAQADLTGRI